MRGNKKIVVAIRKRGEKNLNYAAALVVFQAQGGFSPLFFDELRVPTFVQAAKQAQGQGREGACQRVRRSQDKTRWITRVDLTGAKVNRATGCVAINRQIEADFYRGVCMQTCKTDLSIDTDTLEPRGLDILALLPSLSYN